MTEKGGRTKEDFLRAAIQNVQRYLEERWTPSPTRQAMGSMLRQQFTSAIASSGGATDTPEIEHLLDTVESLYLTIATVVDQCPEWEDDGVSYDRAGDVLNEWLEFARKALAGVSPSHG